MSLRFRVRLVARALSFFFPAGILFLYSTIVNMACCLFSFLPFLLSCFFFHSFAFDSIMQRGCSLAVKTRFFFLSLIFHYESSFVRHAYITVVIVLSSSSFAFVSFLSCLSFYIVLYIISFIILNLNKCLKYISMSYFSFFMFVIIIVTDRKIE